MKRCPECNRKMRWQEGLLDASGSRDMTVGRYYCTSCNLLAGQAESKGTQAGKSLALKLKDVPTMDKRITKHSIGVQLGILRARQHCATCGLPNYPRTTWQDWCQCTDCDCLYCEDKILAKDDPDFNTLQETAIKKRLQSAAPQRKRNV